MARRKVVTVETVVSDPADRAPFVKKRIEKNRGEPTCIDGGKYVVN